MAVEILVGAIVLFLFGFLWYGPVFGRYWVKMIGMTQEQIDEGMKKGMKSMIPQMIVAFVISLITTSVVYYLLPQLLVLSFGEFLRNIFIIWLGFVLPLHANGYLWEKKSLKLTLFNVAESILSFILLAAIIYYW